VGRDSMMSLGVQTLATSMAASGVSDRQDVAKAMHAAAEKADGQATAPEDVVHTQVTGSN